MQKSKYLPKISIIKVTTIIFKKFRMASIQVRFQMANNLPSAEANTRYLLALRMNNVIPHPTFNEATLANDIALVETLDLFNLTSIPLQIPSLDSNVEELILRGAGKSNGIYTILQK